MKLLHCKENDVCEDFLSLVGDAKKEFLKNECTHIEFSDDVYFCYPVMSRPGNISYDGVSIGHKIDVDLISDGKNTFSELYDDRDFLFSSILALSPSINCICKLPDSKHFIGSFEICGRISLCLLTENKWDVLRNDLKNNLKVVDLSYFDFLSKEQYYELLKKGFLIV